MENEQQQPRLTHSSSDNHGVHHVCHKCGWLYPNPHPSAKHRRAHKRICGKVEGYKLFDSEGSTHSNVSDDEHLSDDDHKSPVNLAAQGPKVVEASSVEKGRSESEVFSDAAAEFLDHGVGGRGQGRVEDAGESATKVEKSLKAESNATQSIECGPVAETVKPLGSSSENVQTQHSETPATTSDRSVYVPAFAVSSASFKSNTVVSSVSDCRAEGLAALLDGFGNASVDDLHPIKSETLEAVSRENEKTKTADANVDGSLKLAEQWTDQEGQKETHLVSNLQDVKIPPSKLEGETAGAISKSDKTLEAKPESSPPKPEHDVLQLQEEHRDGFHLKTSKSDVSPEVESGEHANALSDAAEKTVEIAGEVDYVKLRDLVEKKGEVNEDVHVLSVPDDIHKVDNPETMLEDFKDHKVKKFDQSASLECEQAKDKGGDTQGPVLEASSQSSQSEGVLVSSLDKHVLEDSVQLDQRSNARVIKDVLVEGDADLSKLKVGTIGKQKSREANEDVVKPHIEKTVSIFSPEGQGSHDVCSDTLEGKFSQSFDNAISDADSVIASGKAGRVPETHLVSQSWYEKAEQSDLSGDYNSKEAGEVDRTENPITSVESASTRSEVRVDPATNLPVDDGVGKYLKIEGENNDITTNDDAVTAARPVKIETEVDNRSSPAKESCSEQPVVAPVSAKNLSEAEINPETHLISVSGYEKAEKSYFSGDYNSKEAREVDNAQNPVTAAESARSRSEIQVNPATNLRDGDDAGNYVKIGGETVGNDDGFIVACPVKNETVVDDRNSPAKKSFPDQPVVAREFTTTCPVKNETGVDERNTPAKESFSDQPVVARGFATARPAKNETGIDDINSPAKESLSEQPVVAREFSIASPAKNETGVDDINSPVKDSLSEQPVAACEFATAHPANETGVEESFLEQPAIACEFATTRPAKNDTGIDDINSPAKESLSEQPVVAREFSIGRPAKNETGVDDINIPAKDSLSEQPVAAREFATACPANETGVEESFLEQPAIAREFATACRVTNETGVDDRNSPAKGSFSEQPAAAPEFSTARPMRTETGVDDRNSLAKGSFSDQPVAAPEFATAHPVTIETGVDNRNSPESFNEQPVVAPECAKNRSESELNSVTSSQEGDPASSFEKFGTKKDEIMGDSFDAAARHAKDKTGVDNSDSPLKESCSEHPVVIPECARNLAEDKINSEINLQEGDTAGSFEKVEIKKDKITGDASDASSGFSDHLLVTPESAKTLSEVDIYPESNLQEGDTAGNFKVEAQKVEITEDAYVAAARHANDETGVDTSTSFSEENFSKQPVVTPESAKNLSVESYSKQAVVTPGDACDGAARHVKDEAGVDNSKSPSAEIYSKQAVVTPKSAKNLSEVEINPEPILREGDTVSSFGKVEDKKYEIAEDVVRDAKDETGVDNNNVLSNEICLEQTVVAPKSALSEVEVNPETDLREVDIAGIFDKVEEKKVNIIGDACDVADRHAKDESAVDHEKIPSKERCLEQPVVASESAKTVSEVQINSETNLGEGDAAGNFAKAETKKADISGDARDAAASHPEDETGVDYNISPSKEVCSENPEVTPDSTKTLAEVKFNSETDLWERDVAGSFDKVETKKQDISADTCYVTAGHTKDELGVDKSVGPTEESSTEHPIVTLESARNLSDLEVYPEAKEKDNADKFEKVEAKKGNVTGDSCAAAAAAAVGPADESVSENAAVTPESANQHSKLNANPATNSQEGNDTFDPEKGKIEKLVEIGTESKESSVEENPPMQVKTTTESASQTVADDVVSTLDSSRSVDDVVREIHIDAIDHQLDENGKVLVGKEPALSLSDAKSSNQSSTAVEGNLVGESDAASGLGSESFQREIDGQQFGESTNGLSIDSSSQTDSLENNWGSVSVVSVQSEAQAATDADTVVPIESQVATGERANSKESKPTSERQYPDKSEMFEPPSFVTLVEPGGENDLKGNISEIPTGQNSQQAKTSNMQAGWFPSITNVVNESEGRKKNEEIIAKVTNWSTSKSHTPLKNLLGDGSLDTRAKSPKGKDLAPSPHKDDKEASAVNPNLATESSVDQATSREIGNEWNSPARYPAEIKREKRKPKGRPYWAQFMCCSSVH